MVSDGAEKTSLNSNFSNDLQKAILSNENNLEAGQKVNIDYEKAWEELGDFGQRIATAIAMFNPRFVPQSILADALDKAALKLEGESYNTSELEKAIQILCSAGVLRDSGRHSLNAPVYEYDPALRNFVCSKAPPSDQDYINRMWPECRDG